MPILFALAVLGSVLGWFGLGGRRVSCITSSISDLSSDFVTVVGSMSRLNENGVGETPASSNSFGAGAFLTASPNPRSLLPALAANATNKRAMSEVDGESVLRAEKKKRLAEETFSIPEISLTKVLFVNQWGMYESEETWTRIVSRDRIITSRKSPSSGKQESHTHSFATADVLETLSQHELYLACARNTQMDEERAAKEEVKVVLAGLNRTIAAALRGAGRDSRLDSIVADLVDVARIGMPKILAGATMLDGSMITEASTRPMREHHGLREAISKVFGHDFTADIFHAFQGANSTDIERLAAYRLLSSTARMVAEGIEKMCTGTPGWDRVVACLESDTRTEQHNDALYIPTAAAGKGDTEVESMGRSEVMTDDGHVVTHVELNARSLYQIVQAGAYALRDSRDDLPCANGFMNVLTGQAHPTDVLSIASIGVKCMTRLRILESHLALHLAQTYPDLFAVKLVQDGPVHELFYKTDANAGGAIRGMKGSEPVSPHIVLSHSDFTTVGELIAYQRNVLAMHSTTTTRKTTREHFDQFATLTKPSNLNTLTTNFHASTQVVRLAHAADVTGTKPIPPKMFDAFVKQLAKDRVVDAKKVRQGFDERQGPLPRTLFRHHDGRNVFAQWGIGDADLVIKLVEQAVGQEHGAATQAPKRTSHVRTVAELGSMSKWDVARLGSFYVSDAIGDVTIDDRVYRMCQRCPRNHSTLKGMCQICTDVKSSVSPLKRSDVEAIIDPLVWGYIKGHYVLTGRSSDLVANDDLLDAIYGEGPRPSKQIWAQLLKPGGLGLGSGKYGSGIPRGHIPGLKRRDTCGDDDDDAMLEWPPLPMIVEPLMLQKLSPAQWIEIEKQMNVTGAKEFYKYARRRVQKLRLHGHDGGGGGGGVGAATIGSPLPLQRPQKLPPTGIAGFLRLTTNADNRGGGGGGATTAATGTSSSGHGRCSSAAAGGDFLNPGEDSDDDDFEDVPRRTSGGGSRRSSGGGGGGGGAAAAAATPAKKMCSKCYYYPQNCTCKKKKKKK